MLRLWRRTGRHCQSYIPAEHTLGVDVLGLALAHGPALPYYMLKAIEDLLKSR